MKLEIQRPKCAGKMPIAAVVPVGIVAVCFLIMRNGDVLSKDELRSLNANHLRCVIGDFEEQFGHLPYCESGQDVRITLSEDKIVYIGNALNDLDSILRGTRGMRREMKAGDVTIFVDLDGDKDGVFKYNDIHHPGRCVIIFQEN